MLHPLTGVRLRRQILREFAGRNTNNEKGEGLPIRTRVNLSAIGQARHTGVSYTHQERLRQIVKQQIEKEEEYQQLRLTLYTGLTEGYLPVVSVNLVIRGIDCKSFEPLCGLPATEMIWDAGAIITEDILSVEFREQASCYDLYRSINGLRV